jgi:hypothetical protein
MGRSKNACLSILTCAGAGGGGGDVSADPTNSATVANECHCEEVFYFSSFILHLIEKSFAQICIFTLQLVFLLTFLFSPFFLSECIK